MEYRTIKSSIWRSKIAGPSFDKFIDHLKKEKALIVSSHQRDKEQAICKRKGKQIVDICLPLFCVLQQLDEWMPAEYYDSTKPNSDHWEIRVVLVSDTSEWLLDYCPFCGNKIGAINK
jgi:hypothetical protein